MTTIVSPRPPLNIFQAVHANISSSWVQLYRTPGYLIPAIGPNPARPIEAVALLTSLIVTNTQSTPISVFLRIRNTEEVEFDLLNGLLVPSNDLALIELSKQNLPTGESLLIRTSPGQNGVAHLSFVLNQREEYTEL